ncbi:unnamed protein product [Diabrotica balteata]|uniref:Uncharacterized protein n=1 Tax=Diabrotica balteata TaxID=107213 RepID=A0A9N9SRJ7_DIABA|nr:unnamed protein product [Diabrotica balteata]
MDSNFVPQKAKQLLLKNFGSSQDIDKFQTEVTDFYRRCIPYIELWEDSFGGADIYLMDWTESRIEWDEIEGSAEIINKIHASDDRQNINTDNLFDELSLTKVFIASKNDEWNSTTIQIDYVDKWVLLFTEIYYL